MRGSAGAHAEAGPRPAIGASLSTGIRLILIEQGRWPAVRARLLERDPSASEWIDVAPTDRWLPVERHIAVLAALRDLVGDDVVREIGRARMRESMRGGILAPVLRGWVRSYARAPMQLMHVIPHAYRGVTRNLGTMTARETGPRQIEMRVPDAPEVMLEATAWHRLLEGYSAGLLEVGEIEGEYTITSTDEGLLGICRWR
jgi:hypothetical protein